ncbi:MAG: DegV family protein, partial [Collinsella aerofaciens]|nr:DegV family protein [Collinsella aerofaciens]
PFSSFRTYRPPISRGRPIRPSGYRVPTFIRTCADECGRCSDKVDNQGREDAEAVAALIEEQVPQLKGKIEINSIGALIGSHTGPGTVAVFFMGDKRVD